MEIARERNARVQSRYDELMHEGKHGHYETLFRVVREEIEKDRAETIERCARVARGEPSDDRDGEMVDHDRIWSAGTEYDQAREDVAAAIRSLSTPPRAEGP